jgi:hypothetical protein
MLSLKALPICQLRDFVSHHNQLHRRAERLEKLFECSLFQAIKNKKKVPLPFRSE